MDFWNRIKALFPSAQPVYDAEISLEDMIEQASNHPHCLLGFILLYSLGNVYDVLVMYTTSNAIMCIGNDRQQRFLKKLHKEHGGFIIRTFNKPIPYTRLYDQEFEEEDEKSPHIFAAVVLYDNGLVDADPHDYIYEDFTRERENLGLIKYRVAKQFLLR